MVSPTPHRPRPQWSLTSSTSWLFPHTLKVEGLCRSCEPQSCTFSFLDTPQLFLPWVLCLPRQNQGATLPWDLGTCPCPQTRGNFSSYKWATTPHHDLFLKDILLLSSNSIFLLGIRLLENKSQEILQTGPGFCHTKVMRPRGTEGKRKNTEREKNKNPKLKPPGICY